MKVTLAPKRILLKWRPSTKKSEAQSLSSTGQAEKVVDVNCEFVNSDRQFYGTVHVIS